MAFVCTSTTEAQGRPARQDRAPQKRLKRADPGEFRLGGQAREVTSKRGAKTKRFRVGRSAGAGGNRSAVFADVSTGKSLHYRDGDGKWQRSRAEMKAIGLDEVADTLPFSVRTTRRGLSIGTRDGGGGIRFLTAKRPSRQRQVITTVFAGQTLK